ncbi:unnamed protein product [Durusdinium trenchii]|uniref:RRM domain-containing protein n=1 Tax=Durusdinium trenchii TaxID=1381693 RepID=A0ABP0SWL1_9DINO
MSLGDKQKERMAAYVQELLSLDRARQQATLENLSKYADASQMASPVPPLLSTTTMEQAGAAQGRTFQASEIATPAKVELPVPPSQVQAQEPSSRLQHAAQALQIALANWEALVQDAQAMHGQRAQPVEVPGVVPPPGLKAGVDDIAKQGEYALNLAKAERAEKARTLLEGFAHEEAARQEAQEKLKWLAELLETQNKASLAKVYKMLQDPQPPGPIQRGLDPRVMNPAAMAALQASFGAGGPMASPPWSYGIPMVPTPYAAGPPPAWWPSTGERSPATPETSRKGGGPKKRGNEAGAGHAGADAAHHSGDTLRMHLRSLLQVDSSRVLIVRKINRLGFSSPQILKEHFSWYGTVENVLVAHSRVKSGGGQNGIVSRLRPSGLGFVVMGKGEEASKILAEGPEQQVQGTIIRVQKFERRMSESGAGLEDLEKDQEVCDSRVMGG